MPKTAAKIASKTAPKTAGDESFPVASFLLPSRLRPVVMAFYRFARSADDIADDPSRDSRSAVAALDRIERALDETEDEAGDTAGGDGNRIEDGEGVDVHDPPVRAGIRAARTLARILRMRGLTDRAARDLLAAFRGDAALMPYEERYRSWADLMAYCRLSAMPVGRFLLDLNGEPQALSACPKRAAADDLCAALQILNHVQDCGADYRQRQRIHLPVDVLAAHGASVTALGSARCSPALRSALDACLDGAADLLDSASGVRLEQRGLNAQYRAAIAAGERLSAQLRRADPLALRVDLSVSDRVLIGWTGLSAFVRPVAVRSTCSG